MSGSAPPDGTRLGAKTRYRQPDQACTIEAIEGDEMILSFERPRRAVTPGQSVVLYDGDTCIGGGVIGWSDAPPVTRPELQSTLTVNA